MFCVNSRLSIIIFVAVCFLTAGMIHGDTATAPTVTVFTDGRAQSSNLIFAEEDFLSIEDKPEFHLAKNFTIEAWINPAKLDGGYVLLKKHSYGFPILAGDGSIGWYMYVETEAGDRSSRGRRIQDICTADQWQHYVLTYDGESVRVYHNGSQVQSYPMNVNVAESENPILIGTSQGWTPNDFEGEIGLVRIYSEVLSPDNITKQYGALSGGAPPIAFDSVVLEVPEPPSDSTSHYIRDGEELRFNVSEWPPEASEAYLSFDGRIESHGMLSSGSTIACIISVNGVPLTLERLENKAPYYYHDAESRLFWYDPNHSAWRLTYHPWGDTRGEVGEHLNRFVLDITDLMREKDNKIVFRSIFSFGDRDVPVEIKNVSILDNDDFARSENLLREDPPFESYGLERFRAKARGLHTGVSAELNTEIAYRPDIGSVAPRATYSQEFDFKMLDKGGIELSIGERAFNVFSSIRFSGEGWRDIGHGEDSGQWSRFRVLRNGIEAQAPRVAWRRRIARRDSHLEVRDTFTNRTSHDQPVMFVNMLDTKNVEDITEFRIAGRMQNAFFICTDPMVGRMNSTTPVAYVGFKDCGIGMVIEDDAYRNQNTWMAWDSVLASGTDQFYLQPRASYTMVWKIYPLGRADYYDLVNAIRHDWNLFQEIPGLFGFVRPDTDQAMYEDHRYKTAEERAEFVKNVGIDVASTSWGIYGGETMESIRTASGLYEFKKWRRQVRDEKEVPVECIPYMDPHLASLRASGETLEELKERFPNGLALNIWEEPVAYRRGWLYNTLPKADNAVGRHLMDVLEFYMDEIKFDGIYLDEWDFSRARLSFGHSDGVSALLDKNGNIVRKFGHVPILIKEFQLAFADELVKRDATIFANQFASTLELAQLPIVHFAEPVNYNSYLLSAAQVSRSPLSLHLKGRTDLYETVREFLKRGVLTCYYWYFLHGDHVLKRFYPITIREIRPGVVIGEDRIITHASGSFSLNRANPLTAYIYDEPGGVLKKTLSNVRQNEHGHNVMDLELTKTQIAVIIEK